MQFVAVILQSVQAYVESSLAKAKMELIQIYS